MDRNQPLSPEAQAAQRRAEAEMAEIRRNLAAAEQRERDRIDAAIKRADAALAPYAALSEAEARKRETLEEQQRQAREARKAEQEAQECEQLRSQYLSAGGPPERFDEWLSDWKMRRATERLEAQQAAARLSASRGF